MLITSLSERQTPEVENRNQKVKVLRLLMQVFHFVEIVYRYALDADAAFCGTEKPQDPFSIVTSLELAIKARQSSRCRLCWRLPPDTWSNAVTMLVLRRW